MRTINIWALILVIVGLLVYLLDGAIGTSIFDKTDAGFAALLIGLPLIIIGIIVWVVGLFTKKK